MKTGLPIILLIIGSIVGLVMGWHLKPPSVDKEQIQYKEKYQKLKDKFELLSEGDIEEYLQLKTQKEKYEKAEEILGRVIFIFLADLGLRISQNQKEFAKQSTNSIPSPRSKSPIQDKQKEKPVLGQEGGIVKKTSQPSAWLARETGIDEIDSNREVGKFLEQVKIEDFFEEVKNARDFATGDPALELLEGHFAGSVIHKDGSGKRWKMKLDCQFYSDSGHLQANTTIRLSEGGREFSRSRQKGNVNAFSRMGSEKSAALIVTASEEHYFQMYYFPRRDGFAGNYYRKIKPGQFQYKGIVRLERR